MTSSPTAEPLKSEVEIRAREAEILEKPPRIAPLEAGEFDDEARRVIEEIHHSIGAPVPERVADYFGTMLKHPRLMQSQLELSTQLFRGALTVRDRELVILRVAWLCQSPYEWGEHVRAARREAGRTGEEIERVTAGSTAAGWGDHDHALLRAVEEMHRDAMICDETWDLLARTLDEQQLLELPIVVGVYQGVAYLQNSVRFRLMEHNEGLRAR